MQLSRSLARRMSLAWSCLTPVACQAHAVHPQSSSESGPGDDGEPKPDPPPVPTSGGDGTTSAATTTSSDADGTGTTSATSTGATAEVTTTTGPSGTCGDGLLDPGETCDLGFAGNNDGGPCTQTCQAAHCGDGLVWVGEEICDNGPQNNDQTYNGCREDCSFGPSCGDGAVQLEEECDPSAPQGENIVACDPDNCRFNARVAFVTSATFAGNFGGLDEADAACVAAAEDAGLDNASNFLAWISDGATGPAQRFTPVPDYPYARRDGRVLAYDLDTMYAEGLQVPLDITEHGTILPPKEEAWTNTKFDGQPLSPQDHCQAWTSNSLVLLGRIGQISPAEADLPTWYSNGNWTQYAVRPCTTKLRFYCFEQ